MSTPRSFPEFHPDRPITSAAQDTLGRKCFAHAIADRLVAWHGRDCLVAAIYGGWGTGKSSVKNMIVERLGGLAVAKSSDAPHVIEFNPWQFSGSEQLTGEFFATLSEALVEHSACSGTKVKKRAADSAARLNLYGKLLDAGSGILSVGAVASSVLFPPAAPLMQAGAKGARLAANAARSSRALLEKPSPSLRTLKKQLVADFAALKRKILVVVDDIDRLTSDEVCLLFRLIKANTDFPNLVFLLLVQRESAVTALNSIANNEGSRFLEKIVQVPFDLPEPSAMAVSGSVIDGLNKILLPMLRDEEWDDKRFPDIWYGGVRHYFANLREAYRYLNAMAFTCGVFRSVNSFEVNPVDLIAIEALRLFEPAVYDIVAQNKDSLTGDAPSHDKEPLESLLAQLVKAAKNRSAVEAILPMLFPVLEVVTRNTYNTRSNWAKSWKRARRACDPEFFDRFFQICLPHGQVSESSIRDFVSVVSDYHAMSAQLSKWEQTGLLEPALGRLDAEEGLLKIADPVPFICALLDSLENAGRKPVGLVDWEIANYAACWARGILKRTKEAADRDALAKRFVNESKALFPVVNMCCAILPPKPEEKDEEDDKLVSIEAAEVIRNNVETRLKQWAEQSRLLKHPHISRLYWSWIYFSKADALEWARQQIKAPQSALALLRAFAGESTSIPMGSYYVGKRKTLDLRSLEEVSSLAEWDYAFGKLRESAISVEDSLYIKTYEDAKRRRAKGRPDNDWRTSLDDSEDDE